jgi:murein DD-endopeptidase MepM/ murein hydrolase activator NlpD
MPPRLRHAVLRLAAAALVAGALTVLPPFAPDAAHHAATAQARPRPTHRHRHPHRARVFHLRVVFPVRGAVHYRNDFGACRAGCRRRHLGIDLMGHKMQRLVAVASGRVTALKYSRRGNYLSITARGWSFNYLHINNDTPGTDDNHNPRRYAFARGLHVGSRVRAGQVVAYLGDSGNAERTAPHLHFEIRRGKPWSGRAVSPWWALRHARHPRRH